MTKIFFFILIQGHLAQAIVNSESLLSNPFKEGYSSQLDINYQKSSGNVNALDFGLTGKIQYQELYDGETGFIKSQKSIMANHQWSERSGIRVNNQKFLNLRWTEMLSTNFGFEGFFQVEENQFQRLRTREIAGLGPRISLYYLQAIVLNVGLHFASEKNIILATDTQGEYSTIKRRLNSYAALRYKPVDSALSFQVTKFFQPNIEDSDDYRTLTELEMSLILNKVVSFSLVVAESFDSRPPDQVNNMDQKIANRIKLSF
jgi:hypothetical protein